MPGVLEIDTCLGGWRQVTAGYLVEGAAPVLVETGSQSSVPVLLDALASHGIGPGDLAGIAVTHVHLDHAGGVGDVARQVPLSGESSETGLHGQAGVVSRNTKGCWTFSVVPPGV